MGAKRKKSGKAFFYQVKEGSLIERVQDSVEDFDFEDEKGRKFYRCSSVSGYIRNVMIVDVDGQSFQNLEIKMADQETGQSLFTTCVLSGSGYTKNFLSRMSTFLKEEDPLSNVVELWPYAMEGKGEHEGKTFKGIALRVLDANGEVVRKIEPDLSLDWPAVEKKQKGKKIEWDDTEAINFATVLVDSWRPVFEKKAELNQATVEESVPDDLLF